MQRRWKKDDGKKTMEKRQQWKGEIKKEKGH
jgi:hypothetical protein